MPIVTSPTEPSIPPTPDPLPHPGLCVGKLTLLTDFLTFKLNISHYVCSTRRLIYDIGILVCDQIGNNYIELLFSVNAFSASKGRKGRAG